MVRERESETGLRSSLERCYPYPMSTHTRTFGRGYRYYGFTFGGPGSAARV